MIKTSLLPLPLLGLLGLSMITPVQAQVSAAPALMNFQGRLAKPDGTPVADGTYSIRFSLWDAVSAGTEKWNQTIASIQVKNGTFAVLLNTNTAGLFNSNLWLEIKIGSAAALTPRQQIVSVAFAMKANTVPDASIGSTQLATDAASLPKVSGNALNAGGNNIGIGLSGIAPTFPLAFSNTLGDRIALWGNGGANSYGFGIQSSLLQVHTDLPGSDIAFGYGSSAAMTETMRIKGNGNVGIGTNSPSARFTVSDTGFPTIQMTSSSVTGSWLNLTNTSAGGRIWSLISTGSGNGEGAGNLIFNTQGTVAAQLKNTGEFIANVVTILGGSDVAEPYNVASAGTVKAIPGMLVAIDGEKVGQMRVASRAYDTSVAGIISGANGIRPGITLTQKGTVADGSLPVASIGRVWCWCDADASGPIVAGDMLTTSDTPGHAMKAVDRERRDGAIIGKAMSSLKSGRGLVLVLVSLK